MIRLRHGTIFWARIAKPGTGNPFGTARHGILDLGSRVRDPRSWILDPGSGIQDPESWILNPGFRIQASGSFIRIYDFRNIFFRHGSAPKFRHGILFGTDRHGTARNITGICNEKRSRKGKRNDSYKRNWDPPTPTQ